MRIGMDVKASNFLSSSLKDIESIREALTAERAYLIAKTASEPLSHMNAKSFSEGSTVIVEEVPTKEQYEGGGKRVIDLKPHFKASSKARETKGGGWHLIVPIRRHTPTSNKSNRMLEEEYEMLKGVSMHQTVVDEYLLSNRDWTSPIKTLSYEPPTRQNITRKPKVDARGIPTGGSNFIAFRTVSNKSNPSSWILNRQKADQDSFYKHADVITKLIVEINQSLENK